jgi:ABC-type transport system substrate-binding protein
VDTEERRQLYKEFQGKIIDLKPAIILYRPYYLFASKAKIRGIVAHHAAKPGDRFNFVEQWHVNVRRVWNSN